LIKVGLISASIKPETWNIPEHPIITIIVRKISKVKFSKTK